MRVHDLDTSTEGDWARASATVTWEDCERPQRRIHFETEARFSEDLHCNPNAFLLAAILPAMRHGERRLLVEGQLCPELRNGLSTAIQLLQTWYGEDRHRQPTLEPTQGFAPPLPRSPRRTASFLSGGVDALATLRRNRLDFPLEHPAAIRDCFFIHGMDLGGYVAMDSNHANYALATNSLKNFAERASATLIPVATNLRHLDDDDVFFYKEAYGCALAAIAHAFSRRISTAMIASSTTVTTLIPIGSSPLLDPNYSGAAVEILQDGIALSRLAKVKIVSEWDDALKTLRTCFDPFRPADSLNCGQCEKCLRTMTALAVFGKLQDCPTYPLDEILPEHLETLISDTPAALREISRKNGGLDRKTAIGVFARSVTMGNVNFWRGMVAPLVQAGRGDLAKVIESKLTDLEQAKVREKRRAALKRFEKKYLFGAWSKLRSSGSG